MSLEALNLCLTKDFCEFDHALEEEEENGDAGGDRDAGGDAGWRRGRGWRGQCGCRVGDCMQSYLPSTLMIDAPAHGHTIVLLL